MQNRTMTKDPVCGMNVDPAAAAGQSEYQDQTYYFCSKSCKAKFDADPARYISRAALGAGEQHCHHCQANAATKIDIAEPSKHTGSTYTCPMHPEIVQDGPGDCPKCGMALEPVLPSAPSGKMEYTCPMHPEIVRNEPGSCPICGMALEPRTVTASQEENLELRDMTRRLWISAVLSAPTLLIEMSDLIPGQPLGRLLSMRSGQWLQFALATPVVLGAAGLSSCVA